MFDTHLLQCASHLHSIQRVLSQGYPLISSTWCTCYLHGCVSHLTTWPGRRSICYRSNWSGFTFSKLYRFTFAAARARCDTRLISKWSLTGLKFSLSMISCNTKVKESGLHNYTLITEWKITELISLTKLFALYEIRRNYSRIWTRVAVSIYNNCFHYIANASLDMKYKCTSNYVSYLYPDCLSLFFKSPTIMRDAFCIYR